ncbi:MAG: helix-turn-helix domain-containing protein [Anaerolineae bacterium]|nr:helix-turn-helix domain-containing protein [Anaerolineae bacterium]
MNANVTPKQRKAIEALLTTGSVAAAAKAAGVSRQTLYRWRKDTDFQDALRDAEREALQALSRSLVRLAEKATRTLEEMMESAERDSVKVRAADVVLARLLQVKSAADAEREAAKWNELLRP